MENQIRILILEDNAADAELMKREMQKGGLNFTAHVARDKDSFLGLLDTFVPSVVLADYSVPGYDGLTAMADARKRFPDVRVIIVSGVIGEDFAIETIKAGATDYVIKRNIKRLVFTINRALEEAAQIESVKRAEAALRESDERYSAIFEKSPFAITLTRMPEGATVDVNRAFLELFEFTRGEVTGKNSVELGISDADSRAQVAAELKARGSVHDFECVRASKSGARRVLSLNLDWVSIGEVKHILTTIRDITEQKKAEEALIKSENLYRSTLESMVEGCQVIGFDWRYRYLNDPAIVHARKNKEALLGRTMMESYPGIEMTDVFAKLKDCMENRVPHHMENEFTYPDGHQGIFYLSIQPSPEGIFILSTDVTEQKRLERELRESEEKNLRRLAKMVEDRTSELSAANKELESFTYSVSHDLRAPLRAIAGFSSVLMEDYGGRLDDEVKGILITIKNRIERMGRLIDDLLAFSRLGKQELHKTVIDMKNLVQSVFDELKDGEKEREIELEILPLPHAHGDPALIKQVIVNLISNAIKFTGIRNTAKITVGAEEKEPGAVYYVRDNGAGFDMKFSDKLFGIFQRLHGMEEFSGTGVGLAIVQRIIARHGGEVCAEGMVDEGATFYFSLPGGTEEIIRKPGEFLQEGI